MAAGASPTWYVDEASLKDYQALGLQAVCGGKLTPARNKALDDAVKQKKICVQISDDIAAWEYRHGDRAADRSDEAANAAHAAAECFVLSPVAAAQFMVSKMRASPSSPRPKLAGT